MCLLKVCWNLAGLYEADLAETRERGMETNMPRGYPFEKLLRRDTDRRR